MVEEEFFAQASEECLSPNWGIIFATIAVGLVGSVSII